MEQSKGKQFELMIMGSGGQGVLTIGRFLAASAVSQFKHVLFFPNYAPAMRGGDCECTIILSDDEISSPVAFEPQTAMVLNNSSFSLVSRIKSGGTVIVDSSVIGTQVDRNDLNVYYIPATKAAIEVGSNQTANMVLLGAYLELTKAIPIELVYKSLEEGSKETRKEILLSLNKKAIGKGVELMAQYKN